MGQITITGGCYNGLICDVKRYSETEYFICYNQMFVITECQRLLYVIFLLFYIPSKYFIESVFFQP